MQCAVVCYATGDADFALELGAYLELNTRLAVSFAAFSRHSTRDFLDTVEGAFSDYLILLLSPHSVPARWPRERWERILVNEARDSGTTVLYGMLRECDFPPVLRRTNFFDLSKDRLNGQRALKRWLLKRDPFTEHAVELPERIMASAAEPDMMERLQGGLADRPGVQANVERELALAFAHQHAGDFEAVFWLQCTNRTVAGAAGDLAHVLGMSLRGRLEENLDALRQVCAGRRLLLVFERDPPLDFAVFAFEGRSSVLFTAREDDEILPALHETAALFADWRNNRDACLKALSDVYGHLKNLPATVEGRAKAASLGLTAVSLLREHGRLAEAYELIELLEGSLKAGWDAFSFERLWQAKKWILAEWNEPPSHDMPAGEREEPVQLQLWSRFSR